MMKYLFRSAKSLLRSPSFALPAAVCLALGIAVSSVMFGVVDTLLLRPPLHVDDPEAVRQIYFEETFPGAGAVTSHATSYPIYQELGNSLESFSNLGAFMQKKVSVGEGSSALEANAVLADRSLVETLGAELSVGRWFEAAETEPGSGARVAVLGHGFWRRQFGGSEDAVGQEIRVADQHYTIIGIARSGFKGVSLEAVDLWLPLASLDHLLGPGWHRSRGSRLLAVLGRLSSGVSEASVAAEATSVFRGEGSSRDESRRALLGPILRSRGPNAGAEVRVSVWLTGLAGLVLFLAVANVANLQLTRALRRQKDLAVRMAMGAGRAELVASAVVESVLLAGIGCLLAVPLVVWGGSLIGGHLLPELGSGGWVPDLRVAGIGILSGLVAGFSAGLFPALHVLGRDPAKALSSGGGADCPTQGALRNGLLVSQVVLTCVLLTGTGLFLRSLQKATSVDLGMDADRILVTSVDPRELSADGSGEIEELYARARDRLERLPAVERASITTGLPLQSSFAVDLEVPGVQELPSIGTGGPYIHVVSHGYFETLGVEIVRGRGFAPKLDREGGQRVAVVNRTMAELIWPEGGAIDRCLRIGQDDASCTRIVGVVENVQRGRELREGETMQYYVPLAQGPGWMKPAALLVRTHRSPDSLVGTVRGEIQALRADLPYVEVRPLLEALDPTFRPWRLGSSLLGTFGLLALGIAMFGTYGVVAYNVARRNRELGVRIAFGAEPAKLVRQVLAESARLGILGVVLGIGLSVVVAETAESLLFGVPPQDPLSLIAASFLLMLVVLGATLAPALRASRVDPVESLRTE